MINEPVSDSKKTPHSANFDHDPNSLIPSSLSFPAAPKFEVDGDVEIQSPDNSLWESLFSDLLEGDFMISSPPVRNMASPQASNFNYSYNSAQSSLMRYSPNRISSHSNSSSTQKGKGLFSPLRRVFNSPNNQYMQPSESLSLPALENFLDDFNQRDEDLIGFPTTIKSSSESECYDTLDWLTVPSSTSSSSRYSGSVNEGSGSGGGGGGSGSQLTLESGIYHNHHQVGSLETAPLLLQLQQEWLQERQQQQQPPPRQQQVQPHNINHGMVVPPPIGPEQANPSLSLSLSLSLSRVLFRFLM
ncbi:GRAS family protein RAM1 [Camellia lanceoleosa]|nr:GRAS family protein RAM1 [Camellia lanceoleosa]